MDDDIQNEMDDWDKAFDEFYEGGTEKDEDDEKDDAKADDAKDTAGEADKSGDADKSKDDDGKADDGESDGADKADASGKSDDGKDNTADDAKDDKSADKGAADDKSTDDKSAENAGDKQTPDKEVIKDTLAEVFADRDKEAAEVAALQQEAVKMIYPKGIPDPRKDSDGDPITGPSQLTKLVNPRTQELFTQDEAKEWFETATKQYESNVAKANAEALHVTQVNRQMTKEMEVVKRVYGDYLEKNPDKAAKTLEAYKRTLLLSEDGSYIKDTPVGLLEFYNNVVQPQVELFESLQEKSSEAKAAEEAKKAEVVKQKASRDESRDLKQTQPDNAGGDDESDGWAKAFDNYYGVKTRR